MPFMPTPGWMQNLSPTLQGFIANASIPSGGGLAEDAALAGKPAVDLTKEAVKRALGSDFFQQLPEHLQQYMGRQSFPTELQMRYLLSKFGGGPK